MKRNVFIFPEGTRSLDGKLRDFKGGAFTIARKSGCRIVPVSPLYLQGLANSAVGPLYL
jgi:1-acyl-sn-glycerol-3-phosphate acyltransferase